MTTSQQTPEPATEMPVAAEIQWAIVDVLGHNRHVGMLDEFTFAGFAFVRVRVPKIDGSIVPHLIGPSSVYMITPISEERAKRLLGLIQPEVLHLEQREDFMLDGNEDDDTEDDSDVTDCYGVDRC